jgi:hypothetical protein
LTTQSKWTTSKSKEREPKLLKSVAPIAIRRVVVVTGLIVVGCAMKSVFTSLLVRRSRRCPAKLYV